MATAAREEQQHKGAGGKFRKTPFRRTTHTTPYDRPPSNGGGWISKLVDPAHKLLTYSAHRLFSTVFHKRLTQPPPPSSEAEANHEARVMERGKVDIDPRGVQNSVVEQSTGPRATSAGDGFTLLEQMIEQKKFTRPEIDRLKELLHSRTDDMRTENLEKRSEVIPSMPMVSHDRKEKYAKTPLQDKSANSGLLSTPAVSTTVPDEDAASPVELAKAYMDNRPSKVSPLLLGLRSQAVYEDSHISSSVAFPSKSPPMSVVPRFSGNGVAPENGFATPRSRGRSAIHSMARTPYSRVQGRSTFKGVGNSHSGPSSSTRSIWEQSQPSGSKQAALKRRFSVLDNDIGSIGPIRRIRPKPNLLSSRGLGSPMSTEAFQNPSSSTKRPLLLGEPKHTPAKESSENGDNAVPRTCFSSVPSQSSEAASKIFKHLDKITSPKEKSSESKLLQVSDGSPAKLSPSMLRGQALKSLEHIDSSKFLENPRYKNVTNLDVLSNQLIPDASPQKLDKVKENCPSSILDNSSTVANEVESATEKKDVTVKFKAAVSAASNTVVHPPEKKQPFKMSAHEYLELDDDDFSVNGHVPGSFADGEVKVDKIEAANLEKPLASIEVKPHSSVALNEKADSRTSNGVYSIASVPTDAVPKPGHTDQADKNNYDAGVPFKVPETLVSSSSSAAPSSIFSTTSQVSNNLANQSSLSSRAPTVNTNSGSNVATTSAVTTSSSNLFSAVSTPSFPGEPFPKFPVSTATTVTQVPENSSSELLGDKTKQDGGFANQSHIFLPGSAATGAGTGSSSGGVSTAASFPVATNQSGLTFSSGSGSGLGLQASPGLSFKFEPSAASTAVTSGSSSELLSDKNKQGGSFGNVSSTLFTGTFATSASASSNSFGISAASSTPTGTSQAPGSALFSGGSGTGSNNHVSSAETGVASSTQSAPVQPGSSTSVFNFVGNTAFSSGSFTFGSSTPSSGMNPSSSSTAPSLVFGSGWLPATSSKFASTINSTSSTPVFQFGKSSVSAATDTSSISFGAPSSFAATSNNATSAFGMSASASAPTSNSAATVFGVSSASAPTSNSAATVFGMSSASAPTSNSAATVFGMSSASAPTSNNLPTLFGASTVSAPTTSSASAFGMSNGASSTGVFPFTSFATTAASQPVFGSSNSVGFPTAPNGNNDQMSMEDSMAEDTVHASQPTVTAFGQQPVSAPQQPTTPPFQFAQQPVPTPQSPFVFGGGGTNGFSFQSQPNQSNSQNPSPFQASNSLANLQNPSPFQGSNSLTTSSFSLGAPDKSNRRMIKVSRSKNKKK